uniref:Uncharacterized protein n=1 Tax=Streptomyces sp. NBC_00093 TaxID=2975649 RepID=A0AAU2A2Z0_9ACTN
MGRATGTELAPPLLRGRQRTTSAAPTTRSVTGATERTTYGPFQVRLTFAGSRITGAAAVQLPDGTARSGDISSDAVPRLNQETLAAQSADTDRAGLWSDLAEPSGRATSPVTLGTTVFPLGL